MFDDERRGQVSDPLPGDGLEGRVAVEAPRVRREAVLQPERFEDLNELVFPFLARNEESGVARGSFEETPVPGQQDPALPPGDAEQGAVLDSGEVQDVESEDPQPPGQPAQHAIRRKDHGSIVMAKKP